MLSTFFHAHPPSIIRLPLNSFSRNPLPPLPSASFLFFLHLFDDSRYGKLHFRIADKPLFPLAQTLEGDKEQL